MHVKDHKTGEKTHKHAGSFCLLQGHTLPHPKKDCNFLKKGQTKNEQLAAQVC